MVQIYSIEGNIGSGKSTLVRMLKEYFKDSDGIIFADEPVDDWMSIKDNSGEDISPSFTLIRKVWFFFSDDGLYLELQY